MHLMRHIPHFFVVVFLAIACGKRDSDNVILKESTMIDVLYDYQVAMALAAEKTSDDIQAEREYRYMESLYTKYHITRQQFDLSLAHYARNPKTLMEITNKVSARLIENTQQEELAKASVEGGNSKNGTDTVIVYSTDKSFLLNANELNRAKFTINGNAIKHIENIMLTFDSRWLYRDGTKNAVVITQIKCAGDSVVRHTQNVHDYEPHNVVKYSVPPKVESITFHIYQSAHWQSYPQILTLNNVRVYGVTKSPQQHAR